MKNKLSDVRDHLVSMMEMLADNKCTPDTLERAKVASQVANAYIQGVKVEVDACRMAADLGILPTAIDQPRAIHYAPSTTQAVTVTPRKPAIDNGPRASLGGR